jgi:hypothetical protein
MQVQSSPTRYPKQSIRFGGAGSSGVGKMDVLVNGVDATFRKIGASRGREMIVEDLMGFGFLRTGMDLLRGYFFGNGTLNIPAAGERLFREASSIFTDNVLSGLAAWGLGKHLDKTKGAFSNKFTDFPTVELFQQAVENGAQDEQQFLQWISQQVVEGSKSDKARLSAKDLQKLLQENVWAAKTFGEKERLHWATDIAQKLGLDRFEVKIGKQNFKLDNLLDDLRIFRNHMGQQMRPKAGSTGQWATVAKNSIQQTLKIKNYKLLCIALGMASTFAVPFVNVGLTKMVYGLDYYPGEMGLRKQDKKQAPFGVSPYNSLSSQPKPPSFFEKHFPYVMNSLQNGNWLPVLLAVLPLPFALGFFDTAAMRFINPIKKKFWSGAWDGLKKLAKGDIKNSTNWSRLVPFNDKVRNMFDFCKEAPFTAQQQMASIFALLITSRLLCARSDNEFRERMVDSFLGWGLWILGTPLMKKAVAAYLDKSNGTVLQKVLPDGKTVALRTRTEIENLLKNEVTVMTKTGKTAVKKVTAQMVTSTRKAHILLGAGSTVMSMILLGIIEPWVGILWTKHNEDKKAQAANTQATFRGSRPVATQPSGRNMSLYRGSPTVSGLPYARPVPFPGKYAMYSWPAQQQNAYGWAQQR